MMQRGTGAQTSPDPKAAQSASALHEDGAQYGPAWPLSPCEPGGQFRGGGRMASARAACAAQNKANVAARKAKERMGLEAIRSRRIRVRAENQGFEAALADFVGGFVWEFEARADT